MTPSPSLRRVSRGPVTRAHQSRTVRLLLAKASAQHRPYRSRSRPSDVRAPAAWTTPRRLGPTPARPPDHEAWTVRCPPSTSWRRSWTHTSVLGAGNVDVNAGELIAETVHALEMSADAEDIGLTIHPHPTLSETIGFAAEAAEGTITDSA